MRDEILLSVIMPVYNAGEYLREAMDSVLSQTYSNFEFIIINDGSVDESLAIIHSYKDKRIRLIQKEKNEGVVCALNDGIRAARGKYLLRMDADDICFPDRFYLQVKFMEQRKELLVSFGKYIKFNKNGWIHEADTNDAKPEYIKATALFYNVVVHPCVIMRRSLFREFSYEAEYSVTEDAALWQKIMQKHKIGRQNRCLLLYRVHDKQVTRIYSQKQKEQIMKMKHSLLVQLLGEISGEEEELHARISCRFEKVDGRKLKKYLLRLKNANDKRSCYDKKVFRQILIRLYFTVSCTNHYKKSTVIKGLASFGILPTVIFLLRMIRNLFVDEICYVDAQIRKPTHRKKTLEV